ncbi:MAG: phosphatase PAP2 family protein [Bryobacterales bacterium]|nr:phosphatase PAP2 family protein [Bryobacterales bacterium]
MTTDQAILLRSALIAAGLALVSILVLDGPLAVTLSAVPDEARRAINQGVMAFEWLFGFRVSVYLYGGVLVLAGLAALAWKRGIAARLLLFTGLAHVTARFAADIMKPPFSRLRPYEALAAGSWHDTWFAPVGNSFPSGHAVHFWSLFFPLAVLFPRYWKPLVVLPVLISAARVAVNHHYLSDVLASAAVAALITAAYARMISGRARA